MEIKFRGKRKDNGKWVFGSLVNSLYKHEDTGEPVTHIVTTDNCDSCFNTCDSDEEYFTCDDCFVEVDPATVGQYTGRKDKNDCEIYSRSRLLITMYDHWTEREIAREELIVEFRNCKFGVMWRGQFCGLDSFSHNVTFEVVDEEGES